MLQIQAKRDSRTSREGNDSWLYMVLHQERSPASAEGNRIRRKLSQETGLGGQKVLVAGFLSFRGSMHASGQIFGPERLYPRPGAVHPCWSAFPQTPTMARVACGFSKPASAPAPTRARPCSAPLRTRSPGLPSRCPQCFAGQAPKPRTSNCSKRPGPPLARPSTEFLRELNRQSLGTINALEAALRHGGNHLPQMVKNRTAVIRLGDEAPALGEFSRTWPRDT
jgi:hypothetical protein